MTLIDLPKITLDFGFFLALLIIVGWATWFFTRMYYFHYFYETLKGKGLLEDWKTREVLK